MGQYDTDIGTDRAFHALFLSNLKVYCIFLTTSV